jgi:hypothetical protein
MIQSLSYFNFSSNEDQSTGLIGFRILVYMDFGLRGFVRSTVISVPKLSCLNFELYIQSIFLQFPMIKIEVKSQWIVPSLHGANRICACKAGSLLASRCACPRQLSTKFLSQKLFFIGLVRSRIHCASHSNMI